MDINIVGEVVKDHGKKPLCILFGNQESTQIVEDCSARYSQSGLEIRLNDFIFGDAKFQIPDPLIEKIRLIYIPAEEKDYMGCGKSLMSRQHTGYLLITYSDGEPVYCFAEGTVGVSSDGVIHVVNGLISHPIDSDEYERLSDEEKVHNFLIGSYPFSKLWIDPAIIPYEGGMFDGGVYTAEMIRAYFKGMKGVTLGPNKKGAVLSIVR